MASDTGKTDEGGDEGEAFVPDIESGGLGASDERLLIFWPPDRALPNPAPQADEVLLLFWEPDVMSAADDEAGVSQGVLMFADVFDESDLRTAQAGQQARLRATFSGEDGRVQVKPPLLGTVEPYYGVRQGSISSVGYFV